MIEHARALLLAELAAQLLKVRKAGVAIDNGLAVDHHIAFLEEARGRGNGRELFGPFQAGARVDPNFAGVAVQLGPIAVSLDLVEPMFAGGGMLADGRIAVLDKRRESGLARARKARGGHRKRLTQRNGTHADSIRPTGDRSTWLSWTSSLWQA